MRVFKRHAKDVNKHETDSRCYDHNGLDSMVFLTMVIDMIDL